jgi:hypothetical protein
MVSAPLPFKMPVSKTAMSCRSLHEVPTSPRRLVDNRPAFAPTLRARGDEDKVGHVGFSSANSAALIPTETSSPGVFYGWC